MIIKEHRQFLEFSIVGGCISENRFNQVSFLSDRNFNVWGEFDLPAIWRLMPGDIFELSAKSKKAGKDMTHQIAYVSNFSVYTHLFPIGLALMEEEFRRSFIQVLNRLLMADKNTTHQSAITEILQVLADESNDIIKTVDSGADYLRNLCDSHITETMNKFQSAMNNKALEMKKISDGLQRV